MSDAVTQILSGRVVSGNPSMLTGVTDVRTKEPVIGDDGKQKQAYWTMIAVNKTNPELTPFFETVLAAANRAWPSDLNTDNKLFAWKIRDGDGLRNDDKPYVDYCRGCWLVTVRSGWVPSLVEPDGKGGWMQIIDPSRIQVGYHVRIGFKIIHNGDTTNPGLYMNPDYVALLKLDSVLSPGQISIVEIAEGLGQSGNVIQHPIYSSPVPTTVVPATVVPGAVVPGAPVPGLSVPAVPQFTMTAKADGMTRETFLNANVGWTDDLLIQRGYMNPPAYPDILTQ